MSKAIGIQLGRRNSIAAFSGPQVEIVTADDNTIPDRKLTPSVVAYEQGKLLVGEKAYNQLRADPENVIVSIMNLMGRSFNDPFVQEFCSRVGYRITQPTNGTDNSLSVWLGGKEYQPEDIAAEILKKLVQNAQAYRQAIGRTGEVINQAVITIPAYFNDKQRSSTRTAALKAGLTLQELLPEPTAAAISYGYSPDSEDVKTILVYDFGGSTFDASLITAAGTQFIENGKAGDLWLGGDDIDSRIIQFVKEQVVQQEGLSDFDGLIAKLPHYQKVRFMAELKIGAERAKVELSRATIARIVPNTFLVDEFGIALTVEVEITREQFEAMIMPLVERSIKICHEALRLSEYPPDMVDVVLLVGGSSQIPLVQRKVREAFGADKVVVHPRPMYAVAEGAAIVAAGLTDTVGTVSRDYFIKLPSNPHYKVISRGDILPVTTCLTFKTEIDGQRLIHFEFFSPDQVKDDLDRVQEDECIGGLWLSLEQHYLKGTEIQAYLELDEKENKLKITATLKKEPSVKVSCTFSRGRSDEKIYKELQQAIDELNSRNLPVATVEEALRLVVPVVQAANQIIDVRTGEERSDMRDRAQANLKKFKLSISKERLEAEYLVGECEQLVQFCGSLIPQPQQERLQKLKSQLEAAIESHNESAMQYLSEDAKQEIRNLPDEVQMIMACFAAIAKTNTVAPTQASAMADKVSRIISALEKRDGHGADYLLRELQQEVSYWLDQELLSGGTGEHQDLRDRAQAALEKFKSLVAQITTTPNPNSPEPSKVIAQVITGTQMTSNPNPNSLNPYDILGVSQAASRSEITRAVAVAMRRRQYPVDVVARAQRSLLRSEERIMSDYLRPILPTIKRFKSSDLSALNQPVPTLVLLSEFDGLERAIASSAEAERLEGEPLFIPLSELATQGFTAHKEGRYPKAVQYLEDYCQRCPDHYEKDYIQAQMYLVKAYQENGQYSSAIALCKQMIDHPNSQVQAWANKTLPSLSGEVSRV